jgi:plasmid stability protein
MRVTLTIHADEQLREALKERAAMQGKSVSELAREILAAALTQRPLGPRTRHLRGQLAQSPDISDPWRKQIREHNWRS